MTSLENQAVIVLNGEAGRVFLTGSPPELCTLGRTTDLDGLVATLRDAQRSICVSVMTYSAVSRYRGIGGDDEDTGDIWWPVLNDELLRAAMPLRQLSPEQAVLLVSEHLANRTRSRKSRLRMRADPGI